VQSCSANPVEDEKGFPCTTKLAKDPAVAPIVEDQHAINVFVSGALLLLLLLATSFAEGSSAMSL
jgi:hypothetical protein